MTAARCAIPSQAVWLVGALFVVAWMLLTVGCVLFASAYAGPYKGGFSLHDPKPRQRNVGCLMGVLALAFGVLAVVVALR